jgi:hypothetical protein
MRRHLISILAVAAVALTACGGTGKSTSEADARVGITGSAISKSLIDTVVVTATGGALPLGGTSITLTAPNFTGTFVNLPAGQPLTFTAEGFNLPSTTVEYRGSIIQTPIIGQTIQITIVLNELNPNQFNNNAPVIDSLFASTDAIAPGKPVSLAVVARDLDAGDVLSYQWISDGGGTFVSADSASTTWTAPVVAVPTVVNLTIFVRDNRGGEVAAVLTVTVDPALVVGNAQIRVLLNDAPVVNGMTLTPTDPLAARAVAITIDATDTDTNPLAYTWSFSGAGCTGSLVRATDTSYTFAPDAGVATGTICTVNVLVVDGGVGGIAGSSASNTGTVTFAVGFPTALFGPSLNGTPTANMAPGGLAAAEFTTVWSADALGNVTVVYSVGGLAQPAMTVATFAPATLSVPCTAGQVLNVSAAATDPVTGVSHNYVFAPFTCL